MDILQDHLARAHASGGVFARSVAQPPWGLRLPGTIELAVHAGVLAVTDRQEVDLVHCSSVTPSAMRFTRPDATPTANGHTGKPSRASFRIVK